MSTRNFAISATILMMALGLPSATAWAGTEQMNGSNAQNALGTLLNTQNRGDDTRDARDLRRSDRRYDRRDDRYRSDDRGRDGSRYDRRDNAGSDRRSYENRDDDCRIVQRNGRRQRVCG